MDMYMQMLVMDVLHKILMLGYQFDIGHGCIYLYVGHGCILLGVGHGCIWLNVGHGYIYSDVGSGEV